MDTNEVKVGQVFQDGDTRISNPYFRVDEVHNVKPKAFAKGKRFFDIECTKTRDGRDYPVKIALARLIKTGTRGYKLVKGVETPAAPAPAETPAAPAAEAPKTEATAA